MTDVFISHATDDDRIVTRIHKALTDASRTVRFARSTRSADNKGGSYPERRTLSDENLY
jgi:hypothetical protein